MWLCTAAAGSVTESEPLANLDGTACNPCCSQHNDTAEVRLSPCCIYITRTTSTYKHLLLCCSDPNCAAIARLRTQCSAYLVEHCHLCYNMVGIYSSRCSEEDRNMMSSISRNTCRRIIPQCAQDSLVSLVEQQSRHESIRHSTKPACGARG